MNGPRGGSVTAPPAGGSKTPTTMLTPRPLADGRSILPTTVATSGAPMWSQVMAAASSSGAASPMVAWPQAHGSRSPSPVPLVAKTMTMQAGATSRSASPAGRASQPTVVRTTHVVGTTDTLAQQLQALQQAKTLVAHQQAGFAQELASRQDQLRRETLQALQRTPAGVPGLTEALKRWPSPRQEMPIQMAAPVVQAATGVTATTMATTIATAANLAPSTANLAPSTATLLTTASAKSTDYIVEVPTVAAPAAVLTRTIGTAPAVDEPMILETGSAQLPTHYSDGGSADLRTATQLVVPATGASVAFSSEQGFSEEVAMAAKPIGAAPQAALPVLSPPAAPVIAARVLTGTEAVMGVRTGSVEVPVAHATAIMAEDTEGVSGTTEYQMAGELPSAEAAAERAAAAAAAAAASDGKAGQWSEGDSKAAQGWETAESPVQPVVVPQSTERPAATPRQGASNRQSSPGNRQPSPGGSNRQSSPGAGNRGASSPSRQGPGGSNRQTSPAASSPPPRAGRASERRTGPRQPPANMPPDHVVQAEMEKCQQTISWCADNQSKHSVDIIKHMRRPGPVLRKILECVGILFGVANASESNARKILTGNVPEKLRGINLDEITLAQFRKIKKLLVLPDFDEETVKSACKEALPLAIWCRSIGIFLGKTRFAGYAGPEIQSMGVMLDGAVPPDVEASSVQPASAAPAVAPDAPSEQMMDERSSVQLGDLTVTPDVTRLSPRDLQQVFELTVGRPEVGSITFHGITDCTGLEIPRLVHLDVGEVLVYPEPGSKAPVGQGLNKRATVTMYQCWPPNGRGHLEDAKAQEKYRWKIQQMTEEKRAKFIDYDCNTGIWKFQVEHF